MTQLMKANYFFDIVCEHFLQEHMPVDKVNPYMIIHTIRYSYRDEHSHTHTQTNIQIIENCFSFTPPPLLTYVKHKLLSLV